MLFFISGGGAAAADSPVLIFRNRAAAPALDRPAMTKLSRQKSGSFINRPLIPEPMMVLTAPAIRTQPMSLPLYSTG